MTDLTAHSFDVSVVIPAFKAAGFIDRAIDSVLEQSGLTIEIIVVDDACPKATGQHVRSRYGHNPNVSVLFLKKNGGPAVARNAGFSHATGEWIAILDADDAFDAGRLKRLLDAGRVLSADIIADNIRLYDAKRQSLSEPKIKSINNPTLISLYALVNGSRPGNEDLDFGLLKPMFRREFLETSGVRYPSNIRHGEDFHFYFDLVSDGAKFFIIPDAGYQWTSRSSGNSQTRIDYLQQIVDTRALKSRPDVEVDIRLLDLIELRCVALLQLHHRRAYLAALKDGNYVSIVKQVIQHPHLVNDLLHSLRRRLGVL